MLIYQRSPHIFSTNANMENQLRCHSVNQTKKLQCIRVVSLSYVQRAANSWIFVAAVVSFVCVKFGIVEFGPVHIDQERRPYYCSQTLCCLRVQQVKDNFPDGPLEEPFLVSPGVQFPSHRELPQR
jgi:hypothetical protein